MALSIGNGIVQDGLICHLDAANVRSYPGYSTTWFDLSGDGKNLTLTNGPTFNTSNIGTLVFDGTNDYAILNPQVQKFGITLLKKR